MVKDNQNFLKVKMFLQKACLKRILQKIVYSLHYNSDKSYLFVNGEEIYNFKALKNLKAATLALGILHKGYPDAEVKDVSLYGRVYEFSIDYRALELEEIKNIHTYLMKKHGVNTT